MRACPANTYYKLKPPEHIRMPSRRGAGQLMSADTLTAADMQRVPADTYQTSASHRSTSYGAADVHWAADVGRHRDGRAHRQRARPTLTKQAQATEARLARRSRRATPESAFQQTL